jgi:soluble lytic murein transglycosylase
MDRIRPILLVVGALLTMTFGPLGLTGKTSPAGSPPNAEPVDLPPVSSARANSNEDPASTLTLPVRAAQLESSSVDHADRVIAEQILKRLAMRHTALPKRELVELVDTIIREAHHNHLEPALVVAVIEVESAGYHLAVSHVGAMGLMQLLPSTGQEIAERLGVEWRGADTLFDPNINVRLGTAYLSQLARRYGSVDTALAAYNWGPGRIDRRLRRGATLPSRYIEQVMRVFDRNALTLVRRS